jgi:ABC-2 type transport system permease protein
MVARYWYLLRGSWPRILELAYWPTMQMVVWGFITQFFITNSSYVAQAAGVLLSAVLLWDIVYRSQLGVSVVFFEEMYARNLGHLFVSPLRPYELVIALLTMSLTRTLIGVGAAALLAIPLYSFNIFDLGPPLVVFFANLLVFGWSVGLIVCALVLIYGLGAESLAWVAIFLIQPVSGVYYPIATLPDWLLPVAYALPTSHVFEGMRALLLDGAFRLDFRVARERGLLLNMGE